MTTGTGIRQRSFGPALPIMSARDRQHPQITIINHPPRARDGYDEPDPAEIHRAMPNDDAEPAETPSEGWARLTEGQHQHEDAGVPPWFAEHKAETDKRFGAIHDFIRSLHDKLSGLTGKHDSHDKDVPADVDGTDVYTGVNEDAVSPAPGMQRVPTGDQRPIQTLRDLNRRTHELYPRRKARDGKIGRPTDLRSINVFMRNWYAR